MCCNQCKWWSPSNSRRYRWAQALKRHYYALFVWFKFLDIVRASDINMLSAYRSVRRAPNNQGRIVYIYTYPIYMLYLFWQRLKFNTTSNNAQRLICFCLFIRMFCVECISTSVACSQWMSENRCYRVVALFDDMAYRWNVGATRASRCYRCDCWIDWRRFIYRSFLTWSNVFVRNYVSTAIVFIFVNEFEKKQGRNAATTSPIIIIMVKPSDTSGNAEENEKLLSDNKFAMNRLKKCEVSILPCVCLALHTQTHTRI